MSFFDHTKQTLWRLIYPIFPKVQKILLRTGILHHEGRQPYPVGWLAPGKTLEGLKTHLKNAWGFGNHFVAWIDTDQVLSWRKLESFETQYHLRVFADGEIRGHYEFTPEAHPYKHFYAHGEKESREMFLTFLGDYVIAEKHTTDLSSYLTEKKHEPQIIFQEHRA